jgi:hypothetical protein
MDLLSGNNCPIIYTSYNSNRFIRGVWGSTALSLDANAHAINLIGAFIKSMRVRFNSETDYKGLGLRKVRVIFLVIIEEVVVGIPVLYTYMYISLDLYCGYTTTYT